MKRTTTAVLALLIGIPALAENPSYNFVQAGYQDVDLDISGGPDVDGDGFGLGGSFEVGEDYFVFINYSDTGFDFSVDLTQWNAGVGYHSDMTNTTDFFATVSYVGFEIDAPGPGSLDESGFGISVGIRSNISDLIELFGQIAYADLGGGADGTSIGGGIWFNVTDAVALGVGAEFDDDVTTLGANARFYFGN